MKVTALPFVDPVSGQTVVVHFGDAPGVEHPDCIYRATVHPELDAYYCSECGATGRIGGAWFMDLLAHHEGPS